MYVLVHHIIHDPVGFWSAVQDVTDFPPGLSLHHTLTAVDGTRATCLWESESIDAVIDFLEMNFGAYCKNEYRQAENREGFALPARFARIPQQAV